MGLWKLALLFARHACWADRFPSLLLDTGTGMVKLLGFS